MVDDLKEPLKCIQIKYDFIAIDEAIKFRGISIDEFFEEHKQRSIELYHRYTQGDS